MKNRVLFGLTLCLAVVLLSTGRSTPQSAVSFPVIVVFNENAPFHRFHGYDSADDRARANPEAWRYLDRDVVGAVQALEASHGFRADHVYSAALRGFAARLTARQIDTLENDPMVAYVEADGTMAAIAQTLPWGIDRIDADISSTHAGDGIPDPVVNSVHVYIIDTGIDRTHADLNVVNHVNFASGQNKDCNGHGTHVAGTVAAKDNTSDVVGVAPGAPLTGVKVLGCNGSGTTSGVIKGVDWVTANAVMPAIANMSLGGGASDALDKAVKNSATSTPTYQGVFYAVAAGNSGADACNSSPARAGAGTNNGIMTVAATDMNEQEPSWSNFGPCVDIWAPGVSILSTRLGGGTTTLSGTSMASPHTAGTGALYLSSNTGKTPAEVEAALKSTAVSTDTMSKDRTPIIRVNAGTY